MLEKTQEGVFLARNIRKATLVAMFSKESSPSNAVETGYPSQSASKTNDKYHVLNVTNDTRFHMPSCGIIKGVDKQ